MGARAAALGRRSYAPRRRPAGESELGAAGLGLGRGLAEAGVRRVRNAPGLTAGLGEVLLGLATAWGGASSPASGVVRAGVHYGYASRSEREMGQRGSSPRIKSGRR